MQSRVSLECTPELRNMTSGSGTLLTVGFSDLAKWYKFGTEGSIFVVAVSKYLG